MWSTFFFDYSSIWQDPPYLVSSSVWPASIHNKQAWNSPWSQTVAFADGVFDLNDDFPWPGYTSVTHHLWIQEDAWSNCQGYYS